jgi:carbon-monoxide dehydrogenase medium subunit
VAKREVNHVSKDLSYFAPKDLGEALDILAEHGQDVSVLAGGTDLVRDMNLEFKIPTGILWIGHLDLEYIKEEGDLLHIGAATRMQTAGDSKLLQEKAAAVARAAGKLASPPVRSLATLGGNLVTASPAGDATCALLGLGAEVLLKSSKDERLVPLDEFFVGPGETIIAPDELMIEIRVKPTGKGESSAYAKIGRRAALTLAVLNAAARVQLNGDGICQSATVAVGAAAPTPLRVKEAEEILSGEQLSDDVIQAAAEAAVKATKPIDDVHGTAWYRKKLTRVLVERTVRESAGLNGGAS